MERLTVSNLPKGTAFTRYAMALLQSKGSLFDAQIIAEQWRDSPQVVQVLRAAVDAGSTTDATFAASLVYQGIAAEFIDLLRPATIIGRIPNLRTVPFNTRMGKASGGAGAHWVGEAAPAPLSAMSLDAINLAFAKIAATVVLTDELTRMSTPAAEAVVRRELIAAIAAFSDLQFIDPTITAVPGVSPASITNGAAAIASTGGTVAQITTDVKALFAAALTAGISFANGVWVMHPRTALYLSLVLTTGGSRLWPEVNVRGGTWLGLPVITSAAVPVESGNATSIVLLEASEIFMADGTVLLDVSRSASLQMEDAPGTGAQSHVSLWQNNLLGIKAVRYINYIRRQDAGVAVLTGVAY